MTDRESILGKLSEDLRRDPGAIERRAPSTQLEGDPWRAFEEALGPLGGRMVTPEELRTSLKGACFVDPDARGLLPCVPARNVRNVWEADIGITTAELAVAETGSLLLAAGPGRHRLASLAPVVHVALVPRSRIVWTLEEAFSSLSRRTSVLITGTSRTADIEGVLVRGVHGPRELWVVVCDEST